MDPAFVNKFPWVAILDLNTLIMPLVDLLVTRRITGLWTQGSPDMQSRSKVTEFTISYGYQEQEMRHLEENERVKVFSSGDTSPHIPFRHDLTLSFRARFVKLSFKTWEGKPCFRFKLIGCQFRQVNLVSGNSWLPDDGGELLQDNRRETCLTVDKPRWTVTLTSQVHVTDVVLRLAKSFTFMVELWVTTDGDARTSDLDRWTLCGKQEVDAGIMGMRCEIEPVGTRVMFTMDTEDDVDVCEVQIYGGSAATISYSPFTRSKRLDVTCPDDHVVQVMAVKKKLEQYDIGEGHRALYVNLTERVLAAAPAWCPGDTNDCFVLPDIIPGLTTNALFSCVSVFIPDPVCSHSVTEEGPFLLTDDYLRAYGSSTSCSWIITPPSGTFVKLAIKGFVIPAMEKSFMDGSYLVDVGTCHDILEVGYVTKATPEPEMMEVGGQQTYISPEGALVVRLTTCFRYSYQEPEVILETEVEFTECYGCAILSECSGQELCDKPCGFLQSPKYPLDYANNRKCSWRITVASDAYIRLEFLDFDVYEEMSDHCERDVVELFDFDSTGEVKHRLGRYCNTFKPLRQVETGWNVLRVDFFTDGDNSRKGFKAYYEAVYPEYTDSGAWSDNSTECKTGWILFKDTCIRIFNQSEQVTWLQAELECSRQEANLASIHNEAEMTFLNFLLISKYRITEVYIGLTDHEQEGIFIWADRSPLTYTNWQINEPDGGAIEDCSVVSLAGVRAQPSWKDISCAAATVSNFVCSYKTSIGPQKAMAPVLVSPAMPVTCGGGQLFQCSTGECIQAVLQCDGTADCVDGTDEQDCGSSCGPTLFTCDDGQCVSLTFVCDGKVHCLDRSDEAFCDYPKCVTGEFQCATGECIPTEARCDLSYDCADKSDELDCTSCSAKRTFQCYDGTCVPKGRVCDSYFDCPGLLREDESAAACSGSFPQTCLDWRQKGYMENRRYEIQTPGQDPVSVTCDMTGIPGHVVTIVHHNNEAPNITFHGFEAPTSYRKNMTYFGAWDSILTVRGLSDRCEQFMETYCYNAEAFAKSWFIGADGKQHMYNDDPEGNGCKCRLEKVCDERPKKKECYCASPDKNILYIDRGYFTETAVIPIIQLTMEDTGGSHELVNYTIGPFRCYQKFEEGSARLRCKSGQSFVQAELCLYDEDGSGVPVSCRDATHLENCDSFQCPPNFFKCPNSFCVSASKVCDGNSNCKNGQDELHCDSYRCSGMMRCQGEQNCIPLEQRCDGTKQCSQGDDEWFCDVICPKSCNCTGLTYNCQGADLISIPDVVSRNVRKLDISNNFINMSHISQPLMRMTSLIQLFMARNGIDGIPAKFFSNLANLQQLDVSENAISVLVADTFAGLKKLKLLNIKLNPLTYIAPNAFRDLVSLPELDISELMLTNITKDVFAGMHRLKVLDMSRNSITKLEQGIFDDLKVIRDIKMYANDLRVFVKEDFAALSTLQRMHSDDFMFCCFTNIQDENCLPPKDLLSSCEDLMENNILRAFLWILGCMAFCGNSFVFLYRSASKDRDRVPSMLIRNLSAADLLMGLYMLAIASVDLLYRGVYIENAKIWKESTFCQILGCLSTIASEASVFTLGFITIDRLINILFPLSTWKLTPKSARYVIAVLWLSVFIIAAIPLIPSSYFQGVFYSRSGVCVSLYITAEQTPGWEYSFFIFHGLNLTVFIFIFFAYGYMYQIIKRAGAVGVGEQKKREMAAARKMTLIVVTDFCCWVPINIMGFLALSGTQIPGSVYAWTVVFILPVNSALNPILYTISAITFPWQKPAKGVEFSTTVQTERTKVIVGMNEKEDKGTTLEAWMKSGKVGSIPAVVKVANKMVLLLRNMHEDGLYLGELDLQSVYVDTTKSGGGVSFAGCPQVHTLNPDGQATDMEAFGKMLSRLLRGLARARK